MHRPKVYVLATQPKPPKVRKPRTLTPAAYKKAATLEKHVQQAVTQFLELDGWRPIRTEHAIERNECGDFKRKVGEKAMPDYLYIRYCRHISSMCPDDCPDASVIWIEFKRPGEQPRTEQVKWIEAERRRGGFVIVVDDIDQFIAWYKTSGLQRR